VPVSIQAVVGWSIPHGGVGVEPPHGGGSSSTARRQGIGSQEQGLRQSVRVNRGGLSGGAGQGGRRLDDNGGTSSSTPVPGSS
jgi:hypothetical protein